MYFNDIHIIFYLLIAILGFFVGKFIAWCNMCFVEEKKIFTKEFFVANKNGLKNYYGIFSGCLLGFYYNSLIIYCFHEKKNKIHANAD